MADQDIPLGSGDYVPHSDFDVRVLGHCLEALQEGDNYLRNQRGFRKAEEVRRMLDGDEIAQRISTLSRTEDNEFARLFHTLAADCTDFRPSWQYETFNPRYEQQVRIHSNILTWWYPQYGERASDMMVKEALISGTGVGNLIWDRFGEEIALRSENPGDVVPIRPPGGDSYTFQGCQGVIHRHERPVNYVREMFPEYASKILAERDASISGMISRSSAILNSRSPLEIAKSLVRSPHRNIGAMPVVDLFYYYVDDRSRNNSDWPVEMGQWGWKQDQCGNDTDERETLNEWSYEVAPGELLYPNKRLIIFTRQCRLYDGPSIYWHGMYPFVKLQMDPLPDRWFGSSPMWRLLPLQRSLNKIMRGIDDHIDRILQPPIKGNSMVGEGELNKINTRLPGQRWRAKPGAEIAIEQINDLDPIVQLQRDHILNRMREHVAVQTLINAATAGQIPEGASLDKLMQNVTPEIRSRSRSIEACHREMGVMFVYDVAQFYGLGKRITMLGDDGITFEDFDIDPDSLVPAYTNGDFTDGRMDPMRTRDLRPRMDRAKNFYRQFRLLIKPGSMLQTAEQQERLLYMGMRRQKDIDRYTFLKKMGVPNIGPEPRGNVIDRITEEEMGMAMAGAMGSGGAGDRMVPGPVPSAQQSPEMRNDGRISESP